MLLRIVSIIIWCRCDHLSMWKQLFGHRMKGKLWATWKFRRYCIHSHRKVAITSTCIYNYTHPLKYEKIVLHRLIHSWSHHPPVLETKNTSSSVTPVARLFTVSCNSPLSPSIFSISSHSRDPRPHWRWGWYRLLAHAPPRIPQKLGTSDNIV